MNKSILKCDVDDHNTNTGENLSLLPWIGILDIFGFEHFEHGNHFETFLVSVVVVMKSLSRSSNISFQNKDKYRK